MTVETFSPNADDPHITATTSAMRHLRRQQEINAGLHLKLDLTNSGCSGYMYQLTFVNEPETDDLDVKLGNNLSIYIPRMHIFMLQGTKLDYITEGLNSFLKYDNPNAHSECGCGESFSLKT